MVSSQLGALCAAGLPVLAGYSAVHPATGSEGSAGYTNCRAKRGTRQTGLESSVGCTHREGTTSELLTARVSHAVKPFCPRFNELSEVDKRTFWAYFFQALAGAEAGLVPTTDVRHMDPEVAVEDRVTKRIVRQEGLLQLTYMDADRYGCPFDWQSDKKLPEKDPTRTILKPENNLRCGVNILTNQVVVHRKPLVTPKSYWATLRPGTLSYRVFAKQMANVPPVCYAQPVEKAQADQPTGNVQQTPAQTVAMNAWPTAMK